MKLEVLLQQNGIYFQSYREGIAQRRDDVDVGRSQGMHIDGNRLRSERILL